MAEVVTQPRNLHTQFVLAGDAQLLPEVLRLALSQRSTECPRQMRHADAVLEAPARASYQPQ